MSAVTLTKMTDIFRSFPQLLYEAIEKKTMAASLHDISGSLNAIIGPKCRCS
jgi:hypothetical protein